MTPVIRRIVTAGAVVTATALAAMALVAPAQAHNGHGSDGTQPDDKVTSAPKVPRTHVRLSVDKHVLDPGGTAVLSAKVTVAGEVPTTAVSIDVYAKAKVRGAKMWWFKGGFLGRHGKHHTWKKLSLTRWVKIGTITTDPTTGIAQATVAPDKSTIYKVVVPKDTTAGSEHRKATSNSVVVKVRKTPKPAATPTPTPTPAA